MKKAQKKKIETSRTFKWQKLLSIVTVFIFAVVGSYFILWSHANPYTDHTKYLACPPGLVFVSASPPSYTYSMQCNGQFLPADGSTYIINWEIRFHYMPNGARITSPAFLSTTVSNTAPDRVVYFTVEVPNGCASIEGDFGSPDLTDGNGRSLAIDYSEANTHDAGPDCNGSTDTGTNVGNDQPPCTTNCQGTGNGNGTGGNGTGTGNIGTGAGGGSSSGSTATRQTNLPNSTPTSSGQGDTSQNKLDPSPFFDGKEYKLGSDADTLTGSANNNIKKVKKWWPYLLLALLLAGVVVVWRLRRRTKR